MRWRVAVRQVTDAACWIGSAVAVLLATYRWWFVARPFLRWGADLAMWKRTPAALGHEEHRGGLLDEHAQRGTALRQGVVVVDISTPGDVDNGISRFISVELSGDVELDAATILASRARRIFRRGEVGIA